MCLTKLVDATTILCNDELEINPFTTIESILPFQTQSKSVVRIHCKNQEPTSHDSSILWQRKFLALVCRYLNVLFLQHFVPFLEGGAPGGSERERPRREPVLLRCLTLFTLHEIRYFSRVQSFRLRVELGEERPRFKLVLHSATQPFSSLLNV